MASTRMRTSSSTSVFHRVAAADDMAVHDVGTTDANVSGLGGTGEFEIAATSDVDYIDTSKVADATDTGVAIGGDVAITKFISIKHSGYDSADKDTAVVTLLKVGFGDPGAAGFTLAPTEQVTLHGLGTSGDNLNELKLETSSGNIYVEIISL